MEHPAALRDGGGTYRWHAGAPDDESFERARDELLARIGLVELEPVPPVEDELPAPALEAEPVSGAGTRVTASREYVVEAYGEALVELAARNPDLVVLDADLASDCRVRAFEEAYPERFLECGIAEQDMVSVAGGLARHGLVPVVNSFASFLASRANEQIYNNASEGSKVIYALHYAGLIPAGPGMSHQSLRDVSLLAALPSMTIVQPANADETKALVAWAVEEAEGSVAIRLAIGPSPRRIDLPADYRLAPGRGTVLREGDDALVFAYGPVMLHEVLTAAELLVEHGHEVAVVGLPWLNRFDREWLEEITATAAPIVVVEDHAPVGALGDALRRELRGREVTVCGVEGWPAFGTPPEALRAHGLDAASLAGRIAEARTLAGA
jgi:transketolase